MFANLLIAFLAIIFGVFCGITLTIFYVVKKFQESDLSLEQLIEILTNIKIPGFIINLISKFIIK